MASFESRSEAVETPNLPSRPDRAARKEHMTRALRSHQLWLTVAYFGLLSLMARGIAA
jgi:hypothetical protein